MNREAYALWLDAMPGIGKIYRKRLLEHAGEEESVYRLTQGELEKILPDRQQGFFGEWKKKYSPEQLQEALLSQKISFIPYFAPMYPKRLTQIPDAPYALYVKGRLPADEKRAVAMVGARACSEYGCNMARQFAAQLAQAGVQIISGLARGIDGISQQAALAQGGDSFGVLGCGVDTCYPPENENLYKRCIEHGGILAEYPPGTKPHAGLFPARNRIISGLADVLLVIEAREKSGTLITVDMALEQGREVFALPGRANDASSRGCNSLIKQGAAMASSPQDILTYLKSCSGFRKEAGLAVQEEAGEIPHFTDARQRILWQLLDDNPQPISTLHEAFGRQEGMKGVTPAQTAGLLADLVLDGLAGERGRNYYYRRKKI